MSESAVEVATVVMSTTMMRILVLIGVHHVLVLIGEEGKMSLGTLVSIVSLAAALEAGDFFEWLVRLPLPRWWWRLLRVLRVLAGRLHVAEGSVAGFFLSLGCLSLLWGIGEEKLK